MQGTLRDFRVAEILQLVAVQQKTGLLRVQGTEATLTFYFDRGVLVSCRDRRRVGTDPLLDYMRRTGWLENSLARQLESEIENARQDLADLLLNRQIIGADDLANVLEDLAQDLITSSYGWTDGSYLFIAGDEALHGLKHRMSRNVEGLLMEAARRADEWPRLLEKIPGPETVVGDLQRIPQGLAASTRDILEKLQQPITMHELVTQARVPEFEVYETVAQAVENNMARVLERPRLAIAPAGAKSIVLAAEKKTASPSEVLPKVIAKPRRPFGPVVQRLLTWSLALVIMAGCLLAGNQRVRQSLQVPAPTPQQIEAARAELQVDLEVHRAVFGTYPAKLEALVEAELTSEDTLARARVEAFRLYDHGDSYRIRYLRDEG